MKKVIITKECEYLPPGAEDRVLEQENENGRKVQVYVNRVAVRPGQVITVTEKEAERMVAGNVAKMKDKPAPVKMPIKKAVEKKK